MRRGLALALVLAAPAAAEAEAFTPAATEACLAAAADGARDACLGAAAEACMAGEGGSTTVGMTMCLDGEARWWDARLNAAYRAVMAAETAADAEGFAGAPSAATALRDAQRAWIAWRDAACAYARAQWGGGTGAGPAGVQCVLALTGARALELEARAAALAAGAGP